MAAIPDDAPRSPDGHWWYDGSDWQPVADHEQAGGQAEQAGSQAEQAGGLQLSDSGVPLRGDGTPFPDDPSQWSEEERQYLAQYYFGSAAPQFEWGQSDAEVVAVADISHNDDGGEWA